MFLQVRSTIADFICRENATKRNELERALNVCEKTGIANERAFNAAIKTANADQNVSIILFDANNFGKINKQFGHAQGDKMIKQIGDAVRVACARFGSERCFHLHGDEFAVIAPVRIAEMMRNEIEAEFGVYDFESFKVSISGEVGSSVEDADSRLQARKAEAKK